jgi:hypothetical protein
MPSLRAVSSSMMVVKASATLTICSVFVRGMGIVVVRDARPVVSL